MRATSRTTESITVPIRVVNMRVAVTDLHIIAPIVRCGRAFNGVTVLTLRRVVEKGVRTAPVSTGMKTGESVRIVHITTATKVGKLPLTVVPIVHMSVWGTIAKVVTSLAKAVIVVRVVISRVKAASVAKADTNLAKAVSSRVRGIVPAITVRVVTASRVAVTTVTIITVAHNVAPVHTTLMPNTAIRNRLNIRSRIWTRMHLFV